VTPPGLETNDRRSAMSVRWLMNRAISAPPLANRQATPRQLATG
jgi:hypothetical protein